MAISILPEYGVRVYQHFETSVPPHTTTPMPACVIGPMYYVKKDEPVAAPDLSLFKSTFGQYTVATKALVENYIPSYITTNHKVYIDFPETMRGTYDILSIDTNAHSLVIDNASISISSDAANVVFSVYNPLGNSYLGAAMEVKYPGLQATNDAATEPVVDLASIKVSVTDKTGVHAMPAASTVLAISDAAIVLDGSTAKLTVSPATSITNVTNNHVIQISAPAEVAGFYRVAGKNLANEKVTVTVNKAFDTLAAGSYFTISTAAGVAYNVWFEVEGSGTFAGANPLKVVVATDDTAAMIAAAIKAKLDTVPTIFNATYTAGSTVIAIENVVAGDAPDYAEGTVATGFAISLQENGDKSITITSDLGSISAATSVIADVLTPGFIAGTETLALTPGFAYKGQIKVSFRALRKDNLYTVIKAQFASELDAMFGAYDTPENPLGFGMMCEVIGAAEGIEVHGIPTEGDTYEAHLKAIETLYTMKDSYHIVPLTQDPVFVALYAEHVIVASRPDEKWLEIGYFNRKIPTYSSIFIKGSENDPALTGDVNFGFTKVGSDYILTDDNQGIDFSVLGLDATYKLRMVINTVNGQKVVICPLTAPFPSVVSANAMAFTLTGATLNGYTFPQNLGEVELLKYEIIADIFDTNSKLDRDKQAAEISSWIQSLSSGITISATDTGKRRHVIVMPDIISVNVNGNTHIVPGYFLAAGLAGMKSVLPPEQPVAETPIPGFSGVFHSTEYFSISQVRQIESAGCMFAYQPTRTSPPRFRKQITTDLTSIKTMQLSTVTTVDAFALQVTKDLCSFTSKTLLTPNTLNTVVFYLEAYIKRAKEAGMIKDGIIQEVYIDPNQTDRLIVKLQLSVFDPLNIIEIHLYI